MKRFIVLLAVVLAVSGCVAGKQEYSSYLATQLAIAQQQAVERQQKVEAWAAMATACNGDTTCIQNVSRDAVLDGAIQSVADAGGGGRGRVEQFVVQAHPATAMATSLGSILLTQGIQGAVSIRQSDNSRDVSIAGINGQTATMNAAFGLGTAAVNSNASAVTGLANILPSLQPTQNYSAGGHMSLGDMQNGDNAGRDNVRDGSQVGHSGPINTGTQNTGGVIGSGQIGSGRQASPGPYRDIGNGPRCVGPDCQTVNPPPPEGTGG
jgi:hypothetical protein